MDDAQLKPDQAAFMTPDYYATEIATLMHDGIDPPCAFGQHPNAEIAAQIGDTAELLENIVALQPLQTSSGISEDQMMLNKIKGI